MTGLFAMPGRTVRAAGVALVGLTVLAAPAPAGAAPVPGVTPVPTYTYVDLGVLPGLTSPPARSAANDVNTAGVVTGTSDEAGRATGVAFVYRTGQLTSLGSLLPGYFGASFGSGINDAGAVVGYTLVSATEPPHAFVASNGVMTDLGTGFGSGSTSSAADISNAGHIVGWRSATQLGTTQAALWHNGGITNLRGLSRLDSEATAVNDAGQVAGQARARNGAWRAVRWAADGRATDLGTLGGDHEAAAATDIADTGSIVGGAPAPGAQVHAFLWRAVVMNDLGTLPGGDGFSYAYGVNNHDKAVGLATVADGSQHRNRAVTFQGGQAVDLNTRVVNLPPNVSLYSANAINDAGVIVGNSCLLPCNPFQFTGTAFMLIPTS